MLIIQVFLIGMLFVALTVSAITERDAPAIAPSADVNAINTEAILTAWASATQTADAWTSTAEYTPTPSATATPSRTPSATARPSPTPTQPPEPIFRTGSGDSVFYPEKWVGPAVVRITYDGRGSFLVWTQNENGEREQLLANTVGAYHGSSLIDFLGNQRTRRLEVRTAEAWQIELLPLSSARHELIPAIITGTGDEVVLLEGSEATDRLNADASGAWGNFTVWAYGDPSNLLINSVAPYTGTMPLPPGTAALAVKAIGPWSLEVTAR